jgi:hypothetical protein
LTGFTLHNVLFLSISFPGANSNAFWQRVFIFFDWIHKIGCFD